MRRIVTLLLLACGLLVNSQTMEWVLLNPGDQSVNSCPSETDCGKDILCFGLKYTPAHTGVLTSYTTGFYISCVSGSDTNPIISNKSCVMKDKSDWRSICSSQNKVYYNSSGQDGTLRVTKGESIILHRVCLKIPKGQKVEITEVELIGLTTSIAFDRANDAVGERCSFSPFSIDRDEICLGLCTKKPNTVGNALSTFAGISSLDRNMSGTWVTDSKSGFLKLESKTLGFVPTRVMNTNQISKPEEGMVVWNISTQCLEYYNGTEWVCSANKCK